jgi:hypothetical protein
MMDFANAKLRRELFPLVTPCPSDCDPEPGFGYRAFGIYLLSNRAVPGLREGPNPGLPEVHLFLDDTPHGFEPQNFGDVWYRSHYKSPTGEPFLVILTSGEQDLVYWLKYADGTNFFIGGNASRIWVNWPLSSCLEDACTYLLGPVMAIVAQLRGTTCLHGCAVAIEGSVVALLGPQGAGKSTSATAFARAGYPVVADDLILLLDTEHGFMVDPTYPVLRLWPASVELLFGHQDALPRLTSTWEKRGLDLNNGYRFQEEPLPLAAVYFLGERIADEAAPFLTRVSGAPALMKLISNSWGHYADKSAILARQLKVLTRLSREVPTRHLVANVDSRLLPQMCQLLADDVHSLQSKAFDVRSPDWTPAGVGT